MSRWCCVEVLLRARPDAIFYGMVDPTHASLADRIRAQTGIPYLHVDGSFERILAAYRRLGRPAGAEARGEALAVATAVAILRDGRIDGPGAPGSMITAERLSRLYAVAVEMAEGITGSGRPARFCLPAAALPERRPRG
jgi:hypothetical protein